jgi:methyl-accepting chemotaxis protein-1 (serine sensor receptor)
MFSKIKVASGLLCVLAAFCVLQVVTEGLGFWSLTRTHDDVGDLSNVALKQVDAVNQTTQSLMDARINLSRAGTRMVKGGAEPADIVQHARDQLAAADQSFAAFSQDERRKQRACGRACRALSETACGAGRTGARPGRGQYPGLP